MKQLLIEKVSLLLLGASGIVLIALQIKPAGWLVLAAGAALLPFCRKEFAKDLLLLYLSAAILGVTPITTDISYGHMALMGATLLLAVAIPYLVSRYGFKEYHVHFPFRLGRRWISKEVLYILTTGAVAYFLLPFYLQNTGAYLNWTVEPGVSNIARLFIGTNGLGIWDELFFVCTVLGILRRYLPFTVANLIQATLFTSFLYELGFTGWGPLMIFPFALFQGLIFKRTESLLYVITIHLTYDFVLFLALLNAHHPTWVPIFVT